jgi:hypothetical protein
MTNLRPVDITWIFSGIGVFVVAGICKAAWNWWKSRKSRRAQRKQVEAYTEILARRASTVRDEKKMAPDSLSVKHMMQVVSCAAPLARDDVKRQFVGIQVEWTLPFSDAHRQASSTTATVYFQLPDSNCEVRCEASLDAYPFLRAAVPGEKFAISGIVDDVRPHEVFLREVVLIRAAEAR